MSADLQKTMGELSCAQGAAAKHRAEVERFNQKLADDALTEERYKALLRDRDRELAALGSSKAELDAARDQITALEQQVEIFQTNEIGSARSSLEATASSELADEVASLKHMRTASGIAASRLRTELSGLRSQLVRASKLTLPIWLLWRTAV